MATNGRPNKVMSSRLAGMKFMQRSGPPSPATTSEPPSKKQRLSTGAAKASPASTPNTPLDSPSGAAQDDSKWYLSFRAPQAPAVESPLRIVQAGYATLDSTTRDNDLSSEDERPTRPLMPGRKSFGKFNKVIEKQNNPDLSSSSSESESSDNEDQDDGEDAGDPTGVDGLIAQGRKEATERAKAERKAKRKAEKEASQKLAEQRRKKEVNLNRTPTSISNGGGSSPFADMVCHGCGEKGHRRMDCPNKRDSRPSKLRKSY
ncbi:Putative M-phase phosphoprotein [Septoria linicola]|uniref:M-phase phosphoprotein n=1 Tax=Septoria linicola TaxID=215465 RepID=A0A9Q9ASP1_9PEZI|nr:putative M-phase phosphoprotein [Septoria linicola]USW51297.1 Putative M-phase phosphoprotein [Septoria linicola]